MTRYRTVGAASLVSAVVTAILCFQSAGAASPSWRQETLHLRFSHAVEKTYQVGKKKYEYGDRLVDRYTLSENGKIVGHAGFDCSLISSDEGICAASFVLKDGQIASTSSQIDNGVFPISGGTGPYTGALGTWTDNEKAGTATLSLLLPPS